MLLGSTRDYLANPPSLVPAQGPTLLNQDAIAYGTAVLRVMSHEFAPPPDRLAIEFVADNPLGLDNDTLVHLVADHHADPGLFIFLLLFQSPYPFLAIEIIRLSRITSGLIPS